MGWLGGAWSGRSRSVLSIEKIFGIFGGATFALNKRRELRSELSMKVRAMAREMLMRLWQRA
jgi:hypothetical protein